MSDEPALPPPPPGTMPDPEPALPRPRPSARRVAAIGTIVVAALAAAGIGTWLGLRRAGSPDTDRIVALLEQASDRVEFDGTPPVLTVGNDCLIRNVRILARDLPEGVDPGGALRAPRLASVTQLGGPDDPVAFECSLSDEEDVLGVVVLPTPDGPYDEYLDRALGAGGAITVEEVERGGGGDIVPYCVDRESHATCGADWSDGDLVVGVFGSSLDAAQSVTWLRAILPDLLDDLDGLELARIDTEADFPE